MRRRALAEQQAGCNEPIERRSQLRLRLGAPPPPASACEKSARSPRRSAPSPWRGRAGRAGPSATRAGLRGPPVLANGTAAAIRRAAPSLSASSTALVISSTNSGMPSVRSMMSCRMFGGMSLVPETWSIMEPTSRCASRLMVSTVTCGRPIHGGSNSGRKVTISSTRSVAICSTARSSTSRLVGSVQCASSKIISTGSARASASHLRQKRVERPLPALLRGEFERGIASVVWQRQHLGKQRGILSRGRVCASSASSLSSFACGVSPGCKPAALSIWLMIG